MRVWELRNTLDGFETIKLVNEEDDVRYFTKGFQGSSMVEYWSASVQVKTDVTGKRSDSPFFVSSGSPVFSEEAIEVLKGLILEKVEVLPLHHSEYNLFAINVFNVLDCIDYDKTVVKRFSTGKFWTFENYSFKPEVIKLEHIWKIYEQRSSKVFVSDEFRNIVLRNELVGFNFIEIWNSNQ